MVSIPVKVLWIMILNKCPVFNEGFCDWVRVQVMFESEGVEKNERERWYLFVQGAIFVYNIVEMNLWSFVCSAWISASSVFKRYARSAAQTQRQHDVYCSTYFP